MIGQHYIRHDESWTNRSSGASTSANNMSTIVKQKAAKANRPIKVNGYSSATLHAKRARKRREAEARNAAYQARKAAKAKTA